MAGKQADGVKVRNRGFPRIIKAGHGIKLGAVVSVCVCVVCVCCVCGGGGGGREGGKGGSHVLIFIATTKHDSQFTVNLEQTKYKILVHCYHK